MTGKVKLYGSPHLTSKVTQVRVSWPVCVPLTLISVCLSTTRLGFKEIHHSSSTSVTWLYQISPQGVGHCKAIVKLSWQSMLTCWNSTNCCMNLIFTSQSNQYSNTIKKMTSNWSKIKKCKSETRIWTVTWSWWAITHMMWYEKNNPSKKYRNRNSACYPDMYTTSTKAYLTLPTHPSWHWTASGLFQWQTVYLTSHIMLIKTHLLISRSKLNSKISN